MRAYRLKVCLQAVKIDLEGRGQLQTIAAGSVIHLRGASVLRGLVEIVSNGEHLNVFQEDLDGRGDPLIDGTPD